MPPRPVAVAMLLLTSLLVMAAGQAPLPGDGCQKEQDPSWKTFSFDLAMDDVWAPFQQPEPPKICSMRCKSTDDSSCDDLVFQRCSMQQEKIRSTPRPNNTYKKTGGSCLRLMHWMNCGCQECDSWRASCGCRQEPLPGPGAAGLTCKENAGKPKPAILHGDKCTPQCPTGTTTHRSPMICYDNEFFDPAVMRSEYDAETPAYTPCYNAPPGVTTGTVEFLDVDTRSALVSGVLTLGIAPVDASEFNIYWGTSASTKVAGNPILSINASHLKVPVKVTSLELPSDASHILVFPSNIYGDSAQPWSTSVSDLTAPAQPLTVALNVTSVMRPSDMYKCRQNKANCAHGSVLQQLQAGRVYLVEVSGQGLADDDRFWLGPHGSGCGPASASKSQSSQGFLASQSNQGGVVVQLWRITVEYAGRYQACWGGFQSQPWVAESVRTQVLNTLSVNACPSCPEPCQRCDDTVISSANSSVTFLTLKDKHIKRIEAGALGEDLSIDVASDSSYMLVAYPKRRRVTLISLGSENSTLSLGGCEDEECSSKREANCEYVLKPGEISPKFLPKTLMGGPLVEAQTCGDGETADATLFMYPVAVRIAPSGTFWLVVDKEAHRVRRIDVVTWRASVVAGFGQASNIQFMGPDWLGGGYSGDGDLAVQARLNNPYDVAINPEDEQVILIADRMNHRVRKVSHGIITTAVGNGIKATVFAPMNGVATNVSLNEPTGVDWIPNGGGAFIVSESGANRISWVDSCGTIRTLTTAFAMNTILPQARVSPSGKEVWLNVGCDEGFSVTGLKLYHGCVALTAPSSGCQTCKPWNSPASQASLQKHLQAKNGSKIMMDLPENFCRQPFGDESEPWCYTSNDGTKGFCRSQQIEGSENSALRGRPKTVQNLFKLRLPADLSCAAPVGKTVHMKVVEVEGEIWSPDRRVNYEKLSHTSGIALANSGAVYVLAKNSWEVLRLETAEPKCPPGKRWSHSEASCICGPGFYIKSEGSNAKACFEEQVCTPCPLGHYCDGIKTISCSTGFRLPNSRHTFHITDDKHDCQAGTNGTVCLDVEQATSSEQCTCPHGFFVESDSQNNGTKVCEQCPKGTLCPAGYHNARPLILKNGFWAYSQGDGSLDVLECGKHYHCWHRSYTTMFRAAWQRGCDIELLGEHWPDCAAGRPYAGNNGKMNVETFDMTKENLLKSTSTGCFGETQEYRCGRCNDGWVESTNGMCISCGENNYKSLLWLFAWTGMLARFHAFWNNPKQSKHMAAYMLTNAATSMLEFFQQFDLVAMIDIDWPKFDISWLSYILDIFMPAVNFGVVPFSCLLGNRYEVRYLYYQFKPFIILILFAFLWFWCLVSVPLRKRLPTEMPARIEAYTSAKDTRWRRFVGKCAQLALSYSQGIKKFKLERNAVFNTIGFFVTATYVSITRTSLTAFQTVTPSVAVFKEKWGSCMDFGNCDRVLMRFPDVIAFISQEWLLMLPFAILSLLMTTVFIFVSHAVLVWNGPKYWAVSPTFRARRRYFFSKYREDRYYFGLIVMVKSILLNMTILLMTLMQPALEGWGKRYKLHMLTVQLTLLINTAYVCCLVTLNPYKMSLNSKLEGALHVAVMMITIIAITRDAQIIDAGLASTAYLQWALITIALAYFVVNVVWKVVKAKSIDTINEKVPRIVASQLKAHFARLLEIKSRTLLAIIQGMSVPEQKKVRAGLTPIVFALNEWLPEDQHLPEGHDEYIKWEEKRSARRRSSRRSSISDNERRTSSSSGDSDAEVQRNSKRTSLNAAMKHPQFDNILKKLSWMRRGIGNRPSVRKPEEEPDEPMPEDDGFHQEGEATPIGKSALEDDGTLSESQADGWTCPIHSPAPSQRGRSAPVLLGGTDVETGNEPTDDKPEGTHSVNL